MKLPYYCVDAFSDQKFKGNPAGVCLLSEDWLADELMQAIAFENNLSETAFVVNQGDGYGLRWFTPVMEVDLCGHATLACAHVLFYETGISTRRIVFATRSGDVVVEKEDSSLVLDFPARPPQRCDLLDEAYKSLGLMPKETWRATDCLLVFDNEDDVRNLSPNFERIRQWDCRGVIVTAPGRDVDFVSRFFAPRVGVNEDPVTGSAHSTLIPYWAERLHKDRLHALQVSNRGGELFCRAAGDRVKIAGKAITYLRGEIDA